MMYDVQHGHVRLVDQARVMMRLILLLILGRRHQTEVLIDARRRLLGARSLLVSCHGTHLHRFMIAIARVSVNHDGKGGTAPHPLVWDQGSKPKVRKTCTFGLHEDLASLPGPLLDSLNCDWVQVHAGHITGC